MEMPTSETERSKTKVTLINLITDFLTKNKMSMEELDECVENIEDLYYTDAVIKG